MLPLKPNMECDTPLFSTRTVLILLDLRSENPFRIPDLWLSTVDRHSTIYVSLALNKLHGTSKYVAYLDKVHGRNSNTSVIPAVKI